MMNRFDFSNYAPNHFLWEREGKLAVITLNRPEKKNPLTFESYAELRDTFQALTHTEDIKTVVLSGAGGNFCSGGDVFEIIEPLTKMSMPELLRFTRMTGDLILAIKRAPQMVLCAVDGICVGAGAAIAMASDLRYGTPESKVAFLFTRVGLSGCDMGSCSLLPRIIGHGRAAELLYSGRSMKGQEAKELGFFNNLFESSTLLEEVKGIARGLASGPCFAHAMTKRMLDQEWSMGVHEAIESEAQAQAICMQTKDFHRAFEAFASKSAPEFEGD